MSFLSSPSPPPPLRLLLEPADVVCARPADDDADARALHFTRVLQELLVRLGCLGGQDSQVCFIVLIPFIPP